MNNFENIYEKLIQLGERMSALEASYKSSVEQWIEAKHTLEQIKADSNRLKGAFILSLALGGLIGGFITAWEKIRSIF